MEIVFLNILADIKRNWNIPTLSQLAQPALE